jgi:hypothetical protein
MASHSYAQVLGAGATGTPNEMALARFCGTATDYTQVSPIALADYVAATSGGLQNVVSPDPPRAQPLAVDNIFRQVRSSHQTAESFEESMSSSCQLTSSGGYVVSHNPAAYYVGDDDSSACLRDDLPLLSFYSDLANGALPNFALISPNRCDDTTSCSVVSGDDFLGGLIPRILASSAYRAANTAIFVVWDQDGGTALPLLVLSPSTRPGTSDAAAVNDYSLLRATEELLKLKLLGNARTAADMLRSFNL